MKFLKVSGIALLIIILCVAGAAYFLMSNLDALIKKAVEQEGPKVTQTDVLLNAVNIDLGFDQAGGKLTQFTIANPSGFTSPLFMEAKLINVDIDPKSAVQGDVVVIKDITIDGVKLYIEQKGLATNVTTLLKNIQSFSGEGEKDSGSSTSEGEDVRLMVERLKFADSGVHFITEKYGELSLNLPSFDLSSLGDKNTGLTPAELGKAIITPLLEKAKRQAEKELKSRVKGELKDKAKEKLSEKLGEDTVKKLEGLKGLFGK